VLRFTRDLRVTQSTSKESACLVAGVNGAVFFARDLGSRRGNAARPGRRPWSSIPPPLLLPAASRRTALYATWSDDRDGQYDSSGHSVKTNGDVFIVASRDGRHWSQTYGVGTGADEVYPAIAAYRGQVAVSFYTRVYDQSGIGLDMAYVAGDAEDLGRLGHRRVHRVTSQTSNPQIQFVALGAVTGAAGSVHRRPYGGGVGLRRRIASVLD
jgi:hypothetical protein